MMMLPLFRLEASEGGRAGRQTRLRSRRRAGRALRPPGCAAAGQRSRGNARPEKGTQIRSTFVFVECAIVT